MNWNTFNTYGLAPEKAFETLCNQLFENYCKETYADTLTSFTVINGAGGDGGLESYGELANNSIVAMQAKFFPTSIQSSQIQQIKNSVITAMKLRSNITKYIICIPRDLSNTTTKSKNTEQTKVDTLISSFRDTYPSLEIEFWTDYQILTEIQKPASKDIYKFWFENAEIDINTIQTAFDKAERSWLHSKYEPDLNVYGEIQNTLNEHLGIFNVKQKLHLHFTQYLQKCQLVNDNTSDLISLLDHTHDDSDVELIKTLKSLDQALSPLISSLPRILKWLEFESTIKPTSDLESFRIDLNYHINEICHYKHSHRYSRHLYELRTNLKKAADFFDPYLFDTLYKQLSNDNILILGQPGTGKSHGVTATSKLYLSNHLHIPLLISAKNIAPSNTWCEIITSTLGLSNTWSESEIFQGLTSLAYRMRIKSLNDRTTLQHLPKVIIIIDGIDESAPYEQWLARTKELSTITKSYPLIRFCFTSRPFVFNKFFDKSIFRCQLPSVGDVPVYELFDKYLETYSIDIADKQWIKNIIQTPLALKLFCTRYKHQSLKEITTVDISLNHLLKRRIEQIEKELCLQFPDMHVEKNQYTFNTILHLSREFLTAKTLEYTAAKTSLSNALNTSTDTAEILLAALEHYGVISSQKLHQETLFSADQYYYLPGLQGYFDYVAAAELIRTHTAIESINFEKYRHILPKNSFYLLAIISITDHNVLLNSNPTLSSVIKDEFFDELYFLALRNTTTTQGNHYTKALLDRMSSHSAQVKIITNEIILPLSRNTFHPLGIPLLDQFLYSFEYAAKRDLYWSYTANNYRDSRDLWHNTIPLKLSTPSYTLNCKDTSNGLPKAYAWSLSSIDNLSRAFYRTQLMAWSLSAPREYFKLFIAFSKVNDPQIQSDIYAILMCCLIEVHEPTLLKEAAEWLMLNVLSDDVINNHRNIALRYYSINIIIKSCQLGLFSQDEIRPYLPPFTVTDNAIDLNFEALQGDRMSGYSAINYDLARYVLIDNISSNYNCAYGKKTLCSKPYCKMFPQRNHAFVA